MASSRPPWPWPGASRCRRRPRSFPSRPCGPSATRFAECSPRGSADSRGPEGHPSTQREAGDVHGADAAAVEALAFKKAHLKDEVIEIAEEKADRFLEKAEETKDQLVARIGEKIPDSPADQGDGIDG